MKIIYFFTLLALVLSGADTAPTVSTSSATFIGLTSDGANQFLGIPYAQAPVGNLRWKAPQTLQINGTYNATTYGNSCYQSGPFAAFPDLITSEDCLFLNIFTPVNTTSSSSLPVRVWLYGGGFDAGSAATYPASVLAVEANSVIVTVNYRLGIFGFLVTSNLILEDSQVNYGLRDQQLALKWVNQNIAAFGGNSSNVLIFGESAGGGSIVFHYVMKSSWPYFHKGALESAGKWVYQTSSQMAEQYEPALASTFTQCNNTLSCLRNQSAISLNNFVSAFSFPSPAIDGTLITDQPLVLFKNGSYKHGAPMLLGHNLVEGSMFVYLLAGSFNDVNESTYIATVQSVLPSNMVSSVLKAYSVINATNGDYTTRLSNVLGDVIINCGTTYLAMLLSSTQPVYLYYFGQVQAYSYFTNLGVTHTAEIPYVFNNPSVFGGSFNSQDTQVSKLMVDYWTQFHITGNPQLNSSNPWPAYSPTVGNTTLFIKYPISLTTMPYPDQCNVSIAAFTTSVKSQSSPSSSPSSFPSPSPSPSPSKSPSSTSPSPSPSISPSTSPSSSPSSTSPTSPTSTSPSTPPSTSPSTPPSTSPSTSPTTPSSSSGLTFEVYTMFICMITSFIFCYK